MIKKAGMTCQEIRYFPVAILGGVSHALEAWILGNEGTRPLRRHNLQHQIYPEP